MKKQRVIQKNKRGIKMIKSKIFILTMLISISFLAKSIADTNPQIKGAIRSYYLNDQRIQWSGLEATFEAEAVVDAAIEKDFSWGKTIVMGEFYLSQSLGDRILKDKNLNKYKTKFEIEPFEISQLYLQIKKGALSFKLGKGKTPFGKTYFPIFSNSRFDTPFIRTDAILWRETGLFFNYKQGLFVFDLAIVNGEEDKDTNSSKAGIARAGIKGERWAFGFSGKIQDGISSETQKIFKNHAGFDFMFCYSHLIFSGEIIYDEYGFHQDYQGDISWPQGFYYRDIFYKHKTPVTGIGGYLDMTYQKKNWLVNLNYGEYYPKKIGKPYHDGTIKRIIAKAAYNITHELQFFIIGLSENERETEEWKSEAKGAVFMLGLQCNF